MFNACLHLLQLPILFDKKLDTSLVKWLSPLVDFVKLNADGASRGNPGRAGCGRVIRGPKEFFISGFAKYISTQTSVFAEAIVVLEGLKLLALLHLTSVWIERDAQLLVDTLNNLTFIPCHIAYIFSWIRNML